MVLPLFAPGGLELAVILFVSLLLFSPIVALAYLVLFRPDRDDETASRVDELETEVAALRDRIDEAEPGRDDGAGGDVDGAEGDADDAAGDDDGRPDGHGD